MDQKRTIKAQHHYWDDRAMLARHEETRTKRIENQQSMAFGVRTLLAVALGRYINMSKNLLTVNAAAVSKALSLKCTKIEWQAWENRPRDAIASYVFQGKN